MDKIRVQKIISENGFCSRRKADELIAEGKVRVNGRKAEIGAKADPLKDLITVDGKEISVQRKKEFLYIALYKPRGYVSTMSDELGRKCIAKLLESCPARVYPVGRLDKDSEGLILCTNDGDFSNQIMHPSHNIRKSYRVTVSGKVTDDQLTKLTTGVIIDDKSPASCTLRVITEEPDRTVLEMILNEGRNRQIRKMCEAVSLSVIRLRRTAVGTVRLGMQKPGTWRNLTKEELMTMRSVLAKSAPPAASIRKAKYPASRGRAAR